MTGDAFWLLGMVVRDGIRAGDLGSERWRGMGIERGDPSLLPIRVHASIAAESLGAADAGGWVAGAAISRHPLLQ